MSFLSLPRESIGKIGDFLSLEDRESLRTFSDDTKVVFDPRLTRQWIFRQKLTMQDMQTGKKISINTPDTILIQNNYSSEVGTTAEIKAMLKLTTFDYPNNEGRYDGEWFKALYTLNREANGLMTGDGFPGLTALANSANFRQQYPNFLNYWPEDVKYILGVCFRNAFVRDDVPKAFEYYTNYKEMMDYSLFSAEEIRLEIKRRRSATPFTLVKVREINLLDYMYQNLRVQIPDPPGYSWTKDFANNVGGLLFWIETQNLQGRRELLYRFFDGDENTSLEGLRPTLNYRYTHEITVDKVEPMPMSFPLEEGGARPMGRKRGRE